MSKFVGIMLSVKVSVFFSKLKKKFINNYSVKKHVRVQCTVYTYFLVVYSVRQ